MSVVCGVGDATSKSIPALLNPNCPTPDRPRVSLAAVFSGGGHAVKLSRHATGLGYMRYEARGCGHLWRGPAGALTAALLAQQNPHSVAVLEKERFPRHHVGEVTLPGWAAILERAGARGPDAQTPIELRSSFHGGQKRRARFGQHFRERATGSRHPGRGTWTVPSSIGRCWTTRAIKVRPSLRRRVTSVEPLSGPCPPTEDEPGVSGVVGVRQRDRVVDCQHVVDAAGPCSPVVGASGSRSPRHEQLRAVRILAKIGDSNPRRQREPRRTGH